ncbi:arrestin domain-containing protein 3-like [Condylostylus longicornis]|uniref:arrestin domain-containing protein 3-like n=1 Tax=Condylostylus longicornis TaxID=2530218 RepID=UPI00244DA60E|nr:arrestin domain-containing protein 3-like [Condylostylus longicornis]
MPSECFIFFDNPNGVFYTGSSVSGRFELVTTTSKRIRGIVVRITGNANVCWEEEYTEKENGKEVTKFREYTNHQSYLNYENFVLGSQYAIEFDLNPGTYNYTFNCELPANLPSSFTGRYGEIIYEVCVEIDRADLAYNNKFKQAFTVIYLLDLNVNPDYRQPKSTIDEVSYTCCSCFFGSGVVEAEITIPYGGFVSGQDIPYKLLVTNDTNSDIDDISKVELVRKVTFESETPESEFKYREVSLDEKQVGKILRLSKKQFENTLEVPTAPPTTPKNFGCCIRIEYFIKVGIVTACCASNLVLNLPITIGSVPITNSEGLSEITLHQPASQRWEETAVGSLRNLDLPPRYTGPPSYEEAKKLSEDFEKKRKGIDKQFEFAPKYPTYFNYREPTAPIENNI